MGIDAARQDDERHTVLFRVGNHIDGIHDPGPHRRHQDTRRTSHMMHAFGHEAGGVFMFGKGKGDAGRLKGVDQGQDFAARHSEGMPTPGLVKTAGENVGCACRCRHGERLEYNLVLVWPRLRGNRSRYSSLPESQRLIRVNQAPSRFSTDQNSTSIVPPNWRGSSRLPKVNSPATGNAAPRPTLSVTFRP